MHGPTNPVLAGDVTRQVRLARELIAELERVRGWRDEDKAKWIGRLESRLESMCDALDYLLAGTR